MSCGPSQAYMLCAGGLESSQSYRRSYSRYRRRHTAFGCSMTTPYMKRSANYATHMWRQLTQRRPSAGWNGWKMRKAIAYGTYAASYLNQHLMGGDPECQNLLSRAKDSPHGRCETMNRRVRSFKVYSFPPNWLYQRCHKMHNICHQHGSSVSSPMSKLSGHSCKWSR